LTDPQIAWAAGLFEGEGCIYHAGGTTYILQVAMTDKDVIDKLNTIFPGRLDITHAGKSYRKPLYRWRVGKREDVSYLLGKLLPFFGDRRAHKALTTLDTYELI